MRILYLALSAIPSLKANSVQVMKMCGAFAETGNDVLLLHPARTGLEYQPDGCADVFGWYRVRQFGIRSLPSPRIRGRLAYLLPQVAAHLIRFRPDVVYGRFLLGCLVASLLGYKTVYEVHCPPWEVGRVESLAFRLAIGRNRFVRTVFISSCLEAIILQRMWIPAANRLVCHDAADETPPGACRASEARLRVGYVGSLTPGKGIEILVECASRIPDLEFVVAGGSPEEVRAWASRAEKLANLTFLGHVPQSALPSLYPTFDIVLLPNQRVMPSYGGHMNIAAYNSPLKLFEYLSHRKAIIASDLPVLREVLSDDTAVLVPPEDVGAWCAALDRLRESNRREAIAGRGYAAFLEKHRWTSRARRVLDGI